MDAARGLCSVPLCPGGSKGCLSGFCQGTWGQGLDVFINDTESGIECSLSTFRTESKLSWADDTAEAGSHAEAAGQA